MSLKLQAPHPNLGFTTLLPSPEFSDTEGKNLSMSIKRSMDNTVRTYVKSSPNVILNYSFRVTRAKALELREFINRYFDDKIRLTNHKNEVWIVNLTNNPFELTSISRALASPGNEDFEISLSFEGTNG